MGKLTIANSTTPTTPAPGMSVISVDSSTKKLKLTDDTGTSTTYGAETASAIHAASAKTPVDNDEFGFADSDASYVLKKTLWSTIKSTLKTYFDGIYTTAAAALSAAKTGITSQVYISAAGMKPQATNGCATIATTSMATNKQDIQTLDFDKDAVEYAQSVLFRMPSDYNGGTFTYSIDWKHAATTTNFKVAWAVDAVCYANDGALDASWGTAVQVNDEGGTTNDYYTTATSSAVTPGGSPAANAGTIIRVQRVATDGTNDTLAIDAGFIGIQINYTRA